MPKSAPIWGYGFTNAFPGIQFNHPVAIASPPGETNRLFVVEKAGRIMVIPDLRHPSPAVFLDLTNSTFASVEGGALGLAFHPGYSTNGRFFVYRTQNANRLRDVLSEFRCISPASNSADPFPEKILISQADDNDGHNAGDLKFGLDGYLYVSLGFDLPPSSDAHDAPQAIDKGFFGGIIRIDVDLKPDNYPPNPHPAASSNYRVPRDNPFIGATEFNGIAVDPNQVRTEFFAVGFRNPWRFTFDPLTGALLCADVGEGQFEEIDLVEKGGNYGWPYLEANRTNLEVSLPSGLKPPIYSYPHGYGLFEGNAVIGGLVYRGAQFPDLLGKYVFCDHISGSVWALNWAASGARPIWLTARSGIAAFARDPVDGSVLVANHFAGTVERLVYQDPENSTAPKRLSETGAFADLGTLTPAPSLIPFEVTSPLWSDGAIKERWADFSRAQGKVSYSVNDSWSFPPGSAWIKHFDLELTNGVPSSRHRVETRFLVKTDDDIYGLTYRWGSSLTNAILVPPAGSSEVFTIHDGPNVRQQVWNYPSWEQCRTCHNKGAGFALGFRTCQLNADIAAATGKTNQLSWLVAQNIFANPGAVQPLSAPRLSALSDARSPLQHKFRSYVQGNCAQCHNPQGWWIASVWDARISTPLGDAHILGSPAVSYPPPMKIIDPGSLDTSYIFQRTSNRVPLFQMPPFATSLTDDSFLNVLTNWIASIPGSPWISTNIGETLAEGAVEQNGQGFRVYSASAGFDADSVFYLGRETSGSTELTARVSGLSSDALHPEAGLMLRQTCETGTVAAAVYLKDGQAVFSVRRDDGMVQRIASTAGAARPRLRLQTDGRTVSAWTASDALDWTLLGTISFDLFPPYNTGFYVASGGTGVQFAAASFDGWTVHSIETVQPNPTSATLPRNISLGTSVSLDPPTNALVTFLGASNPVSVRDAPPWQVLWTNAPAGVISLSAVLSSGGSMLTSPPSFVSLTAPLPQVWLNAVDNQTLGNWPAQYGREYLMLPGIASRQRAGVSVVVSNAVPVVLGPSADPSALLTRNGTTASELRQSGDMELVFSANDYTVHRGALYFIDWLNLGGSETISFYLPGQSAPAATATIDGSNGVYLPFVFRGEVRIVIQNPRGDSYLSGAFADPVGVISVQLDLHAESSVLPQPTAVDLDVIASAPGPDIAYIEIWDGDQKLTTLYSPPFNVTLTNLLAGQHNLRAVAYGAYGLSGESQAETLTLLPGESKAVFIGADTNTLGSWIFKYGADGYWIMGDSKEIPSFIQVQQNSGTDFVFADPAFGPSALQRPFAEDRVAACIYDAPELSMNVNVLDGRSCGVAFYFLDWGDADRSIDITVESPSGAVLDSRQLRDFALGKYLVWQVQGDTRFRFAVRSVNAVVSGLFFDRDFGAYELWRNNNFSSGQMALFGGDFDSGDADGDGFSNLTEYMLGYNANSAADKPSLSYSISGGSLLVGLSVRARASGYVFKFEASEDLNEWRAITPSAIEVLSGGGSGNLYYQLPLSSLNKQFFRFQPSAQ